MEEVCHDNRHTSSIFYVFVTTKIGCGSAWSNWKQEFRLSLRSPFAIFVGTKIGCGSA